MPHVVMCEFAQRRSAGAWYALVPTGHRCLAPFVLELCTHDRLGETAEAWFGEIPMRKPLMAAVLSTALLVTGGVLVVSLAAPSAAEAAQKKGKKTGTIISVDPLGKSFVCKWRDNDWTYKTTDKTVFRAGGKPGTLADLKLGDRVSLSYHMMGKDRVADIVTIERR